MDVERGFHKEMLRIYEEATKFGYYPTYFLRMVVDHGGLEAAKRLLRGSGMSDGLARLWEEGRLDLSVEALVVQEPWRSLFTDAELREGPPEAGGLGLLSRNNENVTSSHSSLSVALRAYRST